MATDPLTLLSQSNCYACYGIGGTFRVLELALLAQWVAQSGVVLDPVVTAWVARVQANGGGTPSSKSINAINTFYTTIKAAGIHTKMIHVNCIAGDNYITATTPLIVGPGGFNQWQDPSGLLAPPGQNNVTIGLNGDPSYTPGAMFDTGVVMNTTSAGQKNVGVTVYISVQEPDGTNHTHGGCDDAPGPNQFKFIYDFEFVAFSNADVNGYEYNVNGGVWQPFSGFASVNVEPSGPSWNICVYGNVNNVVQWPTFTSLVPESGAGLLLDGSVPGGHSFCWLDNNNSFQDPSAETISFAAIHQGLTVAQAQVLFNAVQTMRVSMGAGYV